jgi:hypothetical protein
MYYINPEKRQERESINKSCGERERWSIIAIDMADRSTCE